MLLLLDMEDASLHDMQAVGPPLEFDARPHLLQKVSSKKSLLQKVSDPVLNYDDILNLSVRVLDTLQQPGLLNGLDHAHFPGFFLLESCPEPMYPTTRVIAADDLLQVHDASVLHLVVVREVRHENHLLEASVPPGKLGR